jgi:outer membrane receptor for ferrienterochelin and colicins
MKTVRRMFRGYFSPLFPVLAGFRRWIFATVIAVAGICFSQQTGSLSGTVTDVKTGKPVPGANIILQGTVLGVVTDDHGRFQIDRIPVGGYTLKISMMGYGAAIVREVLITSGGAAVREVALSQTPIQGNLVVVTASKSPEELASVHQSVEVLGSDRILGREIRRLEEAVASVPGIHFNEENISIRGSSGYSVFNVGSRVLLLVDGVPVISSDLGGINWKTLPLLDIDRIEIVKGAGSALYGSSAMGGVVNLITKPPSERLHVQFRTLYGQYDRPYYDEWRWTDRKLHYERADLSLSKAVGPVGFRLGLSRYKSTGYMENNTTDLWNVSGKIEVRFRNQSRLDLYLSWMDNQEGGFIQWLNQNEPFKVPPYNKEDAIGYKTMNVYAMVHLPLSSKFGMKVRTSFLQTDMASQLTAKNPGAFRPGQGPGVEIQADWIPHALHHTTFGVEFRQDLSGSQYYGEQPDYLHPRVYDFRGYTLSPYAQHAWTFQENATLTLGARWDRHVQWNRSGERNESSEDRMSPKLGINYRPWTGTAFRATFGGGFRAATVFEKYIRVDYLGFNVIRNPGLLSERTWFEEVGFMQELAGSTKVEVSLYQTDYWNMIEPVINFLGTIQFQNYIRARIRGIEGSIESWWWNRTLGVRASASFMDPLDIRRHEVLSYRPKVISDLTGFVNIGPFSFQAEYRYASRVETVQLNPLDPRVPVKLLFLRAEAKWRMCTLQFAINNALNYNYAQIERRMGEIRNAMLSLVVDFR